MKRTVALLLCLVSAAASAREKPPVIRYTAPVDDLDERPVAIEVGLTPQGSDFALKVVFDKVPWGESCKLRCANVTIFVDTDDSKASGLQLGPSAKETGADLAITLQGTKDYSDQGSKNLFKAHVRYLPTDVKSLDEGETLAELDHVRDGERLQVDDRTVWVLVDGTSAQLPSAKKARFIYHPSGAKALEAATRGMLASGSGSSVKILKGKQK